MSINKIIVSLFIFALVIVAGITLIGKKETPTFIQGSAVIGNEYHSTTTYNARGAVNVSDLRVLQSGSGTLGSVVITGAVAGVMTFYDATSTRTNAEWASTTLAVFPASTAAGTYTFDTIFQKGLLVDFSSATAIPTSTITWR
jgi:hypothetical protein